MASTGTSAPAVARRRVSLALRRAREAKNWTQTQVANAMEWSLSKVMRIEKGQVNISPTDLRAVLAVLEVTDTEEVDSLLADARVSRNERYTTDDQDREHLTPAMIQLAQYELEAVAVRYYNNINFPGVMQTADYARAIFANHLDVIETASVEARIAARARRSESVLNRPGLDYLSIIDESVIRRQFGGPQVFARQLEHVLHLINTRRVRIRIAPFSVDAPIAFLGPFILVELDVDGNGVLYREGPAGDEIVTASADVGRHRAVFEKLWPLMLDESRSTDLIAEAAASMRAVAN